MKPDERRSDFMVGLTGVMKPDEVGTLRPTFVRFHGRVTIDFKL